MKFNQDMHFDTKVVHSGQEPDPTTGAIIPPIYQTATYVLEEIGKDKGYDYSRTSNPTRGIMERLISSLEGSRYGVAFSSGMAAVDGIVRAFLKSGDHVVVCDDAYGGVYRLFEDNFRKFGLRFSYVDTTDPENVRDAIQENTRMIWLETPTNPLLKVTDLEAVSRITDEINNMRSGKISNSQNEDVLDSRILTVVDNTFMTPYFLSPLKLGIDIVLHSTTKFLSGHNQLIGGVVVVRDDESRWYYKHRPITDPSNGKIVMDSDTDHPKTELTNTLFTDLKFIQNAVGAVPGPFDCWLTILGVKTLSLRMKKHEENARKIVEFLTSHPKVSKLFYPGLQSHKNHLVAKTQMSGFGGMVAFELHGGLKAGIKIMKTVKLWSLAESLGAVESMITHPASMTHSSVPREVRLERGIADGLVRLSVGIESPEDLIEDLKVAFEKV